MQRHQNFAIQRADGAGIAVREIDTAVRDAKIIENGFQFLRRDQLREIATST